METSLILNATDTNAKALQKTLTNVNPAATNAQIIAFTSKLNALTTNFEGKVIKITKQEVTA